MKRYNADPKSGFVRYGIKGHYLNRTSSYRGGIRL